jgi:hypothetical protein
MPVLYVLLGRITLRHSKVPAFHALKENTIQTLEVLLRLLVYHVLPTHMGPPALLQQATAPFAFQDVLSILSVPYLNCKNAPFAVHVPALMVTITCPEVQFLLLAVPIQPVQNNMKAAIHVMLAHIQLTTKLKLLSLPNAAPALLENSR